jgi:O-antigen/teichoic acid export membrane protein
VAADGAPRAEERAREQRRELTRGGLLAKNTAFMLGSQAVIAALQIAAIPLLIHQIGAARFGVLALAWVMIGYAGLFDLGLGRALTKLTAERLGGGGEHEIPKLFWTATTLLTLLGVIAAVIVAGLSPWLVHGALNIPDHLEHESLITFFMLAGSLPFVIMSAALRGSLEARQRFDITQTTAVPFAFISYMGPVLMSLISPNLAVVASALVFSRVLASFVLFVLCLRVDPSLRSDRGFSRPLAGTLLRFGGWVTGSAILTPFMASLDRFLIGALVSTRAVAYYAVPFEAMKQLRVVSMAFSGVLFPAFATTIANEKERAEVLFRRGTRGVLIALFPVVFFCGLFAPEILNLWVGEEFARNSTEVMQWLSAGILLSGISSVAYGMLQSVRPDLLFKLHLAELPFYGLAFWILIGAFGRTGAAMAWSLRAGIDGVLLFAILYRLRLIRLSSALQIVRPVVVSLAVYLLAVQIDGVATKAAVFLASLAFLAAIAWFRMLQNQEREILRSRLRDLLRSPRRATAGEPSPIGSR